MGETETKSNKSIICQREGNTSKETKELILVGDNKTYWSHYRTIRSELENIKELCLVMIHSQQETGPVRKQDGWRPRSPHTWLNVMKSSSAPHRSRKTTPTQFDGRLTLFLKVAPRWIGFITPHPQMAQSWTISSLTFVKVVLRKAKVQPLVTPPPPQHKGLNLAAWNSCFIQNFVLTKQRAPCWYRTHPHPVIVGSLENWSLEKRQGIKKEVQFQGKLNFRTEITRYKNLLSGKGKGSFARVHCEDRVVLHWIKGGGIFKAFLLGKKGHRCSTFAWQISYFTRFWTTVGVQSATWICFCVHSDLYHFASVLTTNIKNVCIPALQCVGRTAAAASNT